MLSDIVCAGCRHRRKSIIGGIRPTPTSTSQPGADATPSDSAAAARMRTHTATIDAFMYSNGMVTTLPTHGPEDCSELHTALNERRIGLTLSSEPRLWPACVSRAGRGSGASCLP